MGRAHTRELFGCNAGTPAGVLPAAAHLLDAQRRNDGIDDGEGSAQLKGDCSRLVARYRAPSGHL